MVTKTEKITTKMYKMLKINSCVGRDDRKMLLFEEKVAVLINTDS